MLTAVARILPGAMLTLLLDVLTKLWANHALSPGHSVAVLGDAVQLTLAHNSGVAFGVGARTGPAPLLLTTVIIAGIVIALGTALRNGKVPTHPAGWLIGIFLGGALANFLDRLPDGNVTDFIDVGVVAMRWPTFNLADSSMVLVLVLLLLVSRLLESRSQREQRRVGELGPPGHSLHASAWWVTPMDGGCPCTGYCAEWQKGRHRHAGLLNATALDSGTR